ncbi:MAG: hypothetical protein WC718_02040 [Phycisphaerales bacterium]|jgi:hypothetical protein
MAKVLTEERPVSSLARLLNPVAAGAAVRPVVPDMLSRERMAKPEPQPTTVPAATPVLVKRECVLTRPTDEALTRLTHLIRRTTGARVNASQSVRCLLNALTTVWPRLEEELCTLGPLRLPSNARGYEQDRESLEQTLARALVRAMRSGASEGR